MRWVRWAVFGAFCLVLVDKWAGLGFIWPETSQKPPDPLRTVSKWHPSVTIRPPEARDNVVDLVEHRFRMGSDWR